MIRREVSLDVMLIVMRRVTAPGSLLSMVTVTQLGTITVRMSERVIEYTTAVQPELRSVRAD